MSRHVGWDRSLITSQSWTLQLERRLLTLESPGSLWRHPVQVDVAEGGDRETEPGLVALSGQGVVLTEPVLVEEAHIIWSGEHSEVGSFQIISRLHFSSFFLRTIWSKCL